ncbi:MAG: response regulator [Parvibaculaceae bacterium]
MLSPYSSVESSNITIIMTLKSKTIPRPSQNVFDKHVYASLNTMVVVDTSHMSSLICGILKSLGVGRIFEARSGSDALDILNNQAVDMVLIDDLGPPLNGLSVVKEMRASKSSSRAAPVILLTTRSHKSEIFAARDAGVTEILAKPFSAAQMITRIETALAKPRPLIKAPAFVGPDRRRREKEAPEARRASDSKTGD